MPILAEAPEPEPTTPEAELIAAMARLDAAGQQVRAAYTNWLATRDT